MIRVFIADDHAIVRDGLSALIAGQFDMEIVGEAGDGLEAIAGCRKEQPDVAVVDLSMPGCSGVEAIKHIRECSPKTRVLVLTMHDEPSYLRATLAAGSAGYLVKCTASRELIDAIRHVHQGSSYIRMSLSEEALRDVVRDPRAPIEGEQASLSQRERQVLELLAYGFTNKEIAQRLDLATKSIDTYRVRLQDKLGLKGRARLVRYALDHGILKPGQPMADDTVV
jgi:DNA-binding NarL/FixJ family response regulator